jgi:hypothetical protein
MTESGVTTAKPIAYDLTANLPKKKAICSEGHETVYWGEQDMVQCLWRGCHRPEAGEMPGGVRKQTMDEGRSTRHARRNTHDDRRPTSTFFDK